MVGFDDSRLAPVDLTTVGQDITRPTEPAVGRAVTRVEGEGAPDRETVVPPRLVIRGDDGGAPRGPIGRRRQKRS